MAAGGKDQQQFGPNVCGEAQAFLVAHKLDEFVGLPGVEAQSRQDEQTAQLTRAGSPPRI